VRVLLDTNVVVSFLIERDGAQQERAAELLDRAGDGGVEAVLHQFVLAELVYVLTKTYATPKATVAESVRDLLSLPGVVIRDQMPWPLVLELWPVEIGDFTDACLLAIAESGRVDRVATFDRRLIRRLRARELAPLWDS
jgi:predicted nucleic acid-binding protein